MAFPGPRADPESLNVINRVLDAAVTKVTSFESELAVISYSFGTISINLEIDESHTAIVVFEKSRPKAASLELDWTYRHRCSSSPFHSSTETIGEGSKVIMLAQARLNQ